MDFKEKVYPVRKTKKSHNQKRKSKFSNGVYRIVKKIPEGDFLTYRMVAKKAGYPKAWRAVGNVLNKNKDPRISCHRVIRSDGKIGGYNRGKKKKMLLLKKEGIKINPFGKLRVNPERRRRIKHGKIASRFRK